MIAWLWNFKQLYLFNTNTLQNTKLYTHVGSLLDAMQASPLFRQLILARVWLARVTWYPVCSSVVGTRLREKLCMAVAGAVFPSIHNNLVGWGPCARAGQGRALPAFMSLSSRMTSSARSEFKLKSDSCHVTFVYFTE